MRSFKITFAERFKRMDPTLLICTTVLSLMSLVTIFGAVDNFGQSKLIMQGAMTLLGFGLIFLVANVDYRYTIDKLYIVMFMFSVLILAVTLLFGISGANMETSNRSWLTIIDIGSFKISYHKHPRKSSVNQEFIPHLTEFLRILIPLIDK